MTPTETNTAMRGVLSTTEELNAETRHLLRLLRQWLTGLHDKDTGVWQEAWNDLCAAKGSAKARRVLVAVERFIKIISQDADRSITFRPIPCGFVGMDEGVMLLLLRKAGSGDRMGAVATAAGLVQTGAASDLAEAALQLHEVFAGTPATAPDRQSFLSGGWLSRDRPMENTTVH